jgi:hypothetical protein
MPLYIRGAISFVEVVNRALLMFGLVVNPFVYAIFPCRVARHPVVLAGGELSRDLSNIKQAESEVFSAETEDEIANLCIFANVTLTDGKT